MIVRADRPGTADRRRRRTTVAQTALVVSVYYLVPVVEPLQGVWSWVRTAVGAAVSLLAVWWIGRQVAREMRSPEADDRPGRLLLLVLAGVVFFALVDLGLARAAPGQFTGLETKTDALYFTMTTLLTVGFGDVRADGQLARGLLIVQLAFNAVVLTRAAHAFSRRVAGRTGQGPGTSPRPDYPDGSPRA